jgi:putative ABC transport system permease protein
MSPIRIAWRLVQARGMHHGVTALVLALGLGLMLATVAVGDATRDAVSAMAERYPMVVGPRVGAVPLVLGSLTGLQDLDAAVALEEVDDLEADPRVEVAVPLLAGHAVQGHPLLATSPDLLQPRSRFPLLDGRVFEADAHDEVLLGASAADALGLGVGDKVTIEHNHAGAPEDPGHLRVVGVLAPTRGSLDDSLICPLAAIYHSHAAHDHDHDHDHTTHDHTTHDHTAHDHAPTAHDHAHPLSPLVSSILIRPTDQAALLSLQEDLQARDLEVALTGQTLRRVADRLAGGGRLLRLLVGGVVLITFLSLLMSIYSSSLAQTRDIAALRVMGARRLEVLGIVAMATTMVVLAGTAGSLIVGGVLGGVAEGVLRDELGLELTVSLLGGQAPAYLAGGLVLLVLVGVQPALAAYHLQAAEALGAQVGSGLASRSYLRWSLRFLIPLAIFVWAEQMVAQHGSEGFSRPLDAESSALFDAHRRWTTGAAPPELASLDGGEVVVEGYMYALGGPWEAEEFYLVALNPRLPRCPFCYRAPTRHERILVQSPGAAVEIAPGLVRISGRLTLEPEGRDQLVLALDTLEVVVEP